MVRAAQGRHAPDHAGNGTLRTPESQCLRDRLGLCADIAARSQQAKLAEQARIVAFELHGLPPDGTSSPDALYALHA
jgi:hypothetical protein